VAGTAFAAFASATIIVGEELVRVEQIKVCAWHP
jgi:hypothetical protein